MFNTMVPNLKYSLQGNAIPLILTQIGFANDFAVLRVSFDDRCGIQPPTHTGRPETEISYSIKLFESCLPTPPDLLLNTIYLLKFTDNKNFCDATKKSTVDKKQY